MTLETQRLLLSKPRNIGGLDMHGAMYGSSEVQARIVECPDLVKPMGRPDFTAPLAAVNGHKWSLASNQGETT